METLHRKQKINLTTPLLLDYDYRTTKRQRLSAPDSIAVFLCLKFKSPDLVISIIGSREPNTIPEKGISSADWRQ